MKDFNCITENSKFSDSEKAHGRELYQQYLLRFGGATDKAVEATEKALTIKQKIRKADNLRAARIFAERALDLEDFGRGNNRFDDGVLSFIAPDYAGHRRVLNLENEQHAIKAQALAMMGRVTYNYRKRGLGGQGESFLGTGKRKIDPEDLILEMEGKIDTGNKEAKAMAAATKTTFEWLRLMKNKYGAHIPKNERWLVPQNHSQLKIRNIGNGTLSYEQKFDLWFDFIKDKLDKDNMISYKTGQPITDMEFNFLLRDIFDNISNGSKNKQGGWVKTMSEHRVLQFKTASDWIAYHKKFGDGDIALNLFNYVDHMSHDIAELKVLGPKPQQTLNLLQERAVTLMRANGGYKEQAVTAMRTNVQNHYDVYKRRQLIPQYEALAEGGSTIRNLATAAYLGSAVISAIGDFGTQIATAQRMGQKGFTPLKFHMQAILSVLQPMKRQERIQWAINHGLVMDSAINFAQAKAKIADEIAGTPWSQAVSDTVLRASLLTAFTDAGRFAQAQSVMQMFSDRFGKKFADLEPEFQTHLKTYGLDKDWDDVLSKVPPQEFQGSKYLTYRDIQDYTGNGLDNYELSTKYLAMIHNIQNDAVITNSIKTMANMYGNINRGTLGGELLKSAFMFKSFSVGIFIQHLARMAHETPDLMRTKHFGMQLSPGAARIMNIAKFISTLTMLGAVAEQLHQIKSGRDPMDMESGDFWISAFTRGGGAGFIGDIITNNAMGYGLQLLGPLADVIGDSWDLVANNASAAASGDETEVTYDVYKMLKKYTPGQSLWYLQLGLNRMILENIATSIDPHIESKIRSNARRQESVRKQDYWWRPGDSFPQRAPDLGAANLGEALTIGGD